MRYVSLTIIFGGVMASVAVAQVQPAPAPATTAKPELRAAAVGGVPPASKPGALDGVWMPKSCQSEGQEQLDDKTRSALRLSVEHGEHKLYFLTDEEKMIGKRLSKSAITLDETDKTFELTITDGINKDQKVHGLYEVTDQALKLCYGPVNAARPTTFDAPKQKLGQFNEEWTRYKKK